MSSILEKLYGFNPPDRTLPKDRYIAEAIYEAAAEIERLRALCAEASGTMRLCACCQKNEIVDKLRSAGRVEEK